jgi:hypothetical protein
LGKRRGRRAHPARLAAALVVLFGANAALSAEPPLVGLFEGHGIAPPADPAKALAAQVAAQRLSLQCYYFWARDEGGVQREVRPCDGAAARSREQLGPDAAAAILDVLDHPRTDRSERSTVATMGWLLDALVGTGRADVVPVLIRALERLSARRALSDARVRAQFEDEWQKLVQAIEAITYWPTPVGTDSPGDGEGGGDAVLADTARKWRAWYEVHGKETLGEWREAKIAEHKRLALSLDPAESRAALEWLCRLPTPAGDCLPRLEAIVREDPECVERCDGLRFLIEELRGSERHSPPRRDR